MVKHDFVVHTSWRGGREEIGKVNGDVISEQISIPSSLGGNGTGTNPDEMLVAAASSCYIISLAATLERAKYPTISLTEEEKTHLNKRLPKLLDIADHHCMISNSIRNNVKIEIQATIQD